MREVNRSNSQNTAESKRTCCKASCKSADESESDDDDEENDEDEAKKPATSGKQKRSSRDKEMMMIMYQDKDEVNKAKIEKALQQYNAKHLTEARCSQSRSIQESMQMSSRGKQMIRPSGRDNYREHREQDSRGWEHQFQHGI